MRPTDENQPTSTRPNLMSPRRTSGEDSILAMLERDPARKRGKASTPASGARLAWYGTSAALAVALTGVLVWLAAGNDGRKPDASGQDGALMADLSRPAPPQGAPLDMGTAPATLLAAADTPAVRQVAMTAGSEAALRPGSAAVIVDQPPPDKLPPLRLLKPAPAKQAAPVRVPVPAPARTVPPRPGAVARTAPPPARPAAMPPPELRQAARAAPVAAAVPRARPTVATRSAVKPAAGKPQRTVNPARTGEQVDADVALISAVIVHANGHAPEGSHMTELLCPNDSCKEKPARP